MIHLGKTGTFICFGWRKMFFRWSPKNPLWGSELCSCWCCLLTWYWVCCNYWSSLCSGTYNGLSGIWLFFLQNCLIASNVLNPMSSVVIMMKISIYLYIILDGRHFLHHILHYSIKEGKSSTFLFFTRIVHCWRLQLTKLKTEINCWKRMASKHGLPSESCPCIQYPLFGGEGTKPITRLNFQKEMSEWCASCWCLLMREFPPSFIDIC